MAPLAGLVAAILLASRLHARLAPQRLGRLLAGGIAAGLALLLALDVPAAATRLGMQWASSSAPSERERGLTLLRTLGDHDLLLAPLLRHRWTAEPGCSAPSSCGVATACSSPERRQIVQSPAEVREVYYRVTGKPFNAQPAPFKAGRLGDFAFDADHGGTEVGRPHQGARHRLVAHGRVGRRQRRGGLHRVDLRVPQHLAHRPGGAAADRAAAGRRGVARHAVGERRGEGGRLRRARRGARGLPAGRRGAAARPAAGHHARRRPRAGAGLPRGPQRRHHQVQDRHHRAAGVDASGGKARLTLPAVFDRNFSFPKDVGHSVWIEGKQPLAATAKGLAATRIDGGLFRLAGHARRRRPGAPAPDASRSSATADTGRPVAQARRRRGRGSGGRRRHRRSRAP